MIILELWSCGAVELHSVNKPFSEECQPAGVTLYCDLQGLTMMHKWSIVLLPPGIHQELVEFLSFSPVFPIIIDKAAWYIGNHTISWADSCCNIYCDVQSSHEVCLIRISLETIRLGRARLDWVYHWTNWYFVFRSRRKFIASSQKVKC